jgi:NAD(P)-dependent dehydrogenase (short-subunit alcohol dehydrogenase family)
VDTDQKELLTPYEKCWRFAGEASEQITGIIPVGRVDAAEHVAAAVLYLCSDDAKFTVGTLLVVDGGFSAG